MLITTDPIENFHSDESEPSNSKDLEVDDVIAIKNSKRLINAVVENFNLFLVH